MCCLHTADVLGEGLEPGVHLDELDVGEDLVHFLDSTVSDGDSLSPEIRRESGADHLQTQEHTQH